MGSIFQNAYSKMNRFVVYIVTIALVVTVVLTQNIKVANADVGDPYEHVTYAASIIPFFDSKYCDGDTFLTTNNNVNIIYNNCKSMQDFYDEMYLVLKNENLAALGKIAGELNDELTQLNSRYSAVGVHTNDLLPLGLAASSEFQAFYHISRDFDNNVAFQASYDAYSVLVNVHDRKGASEQSLAKFYRDASSFIMTRYGISGYNVVSNNWWQACRESHKNQLVPSNSPSGDLCVDAWIQEASRSANAHDFAVNETGDPNSDQQKLEAATTKALQSQRLESSYFQSETDEGDDLSQATNLTSALPILHRIYFENLDHDGAISNEDWTTLENANINTESLQLLMNGELTFETMGVDKIMAQFLNNGVAERIIDSRIGVCAALDGKSPADENSESLALRKSCTGAASDVKFSGISFGLVSDEAKSTALSYRDVVQSSDDDDLKEVINAQHEDGTTPLTQLINSDSGFNNIGIDIAHVNIPNTLGSAQDVRFAWQTASTNNGVIEKRYTNSQGNEQYILWNDDNNHYSDNTKYYLSENIENNLYHKVQGRDNSIIGLRSKDAGLHNVYMWFIDASGKVINTDGSETSHNDNSFRESKEDGAKDNASINWQSKSSDQDWTQKIPLNAQKVEILNHINGCGSSSRCTATYELNYNDIKPYNTIEVQGTSNANIDNQTSSHVYCNGTWGGDGDKVNNAADNNWSSLLQDKSHCDTEWTGRLITESDASNYGLATSFAVGLTGNFAKVYSVEYGVLSASELPQSNNKPNILSFSSNASVNTLIKDSGTIKHIYVSLAPSQNIYKYATAVDNAWGNDIQTSFNRATNIGASTSGTSLANNKPIQNLAVGSAFSDHNSDLSVSGTFINTGIEKRTVEAQDWIESSDTTHNSCILVYDPVNGDMQSPNMAHLALPNGNGAFWNDTNKSLSINSAKNYYLDARDGLDCNLSAEMNPYADTAVWVNYDKFGNPTLGNVKYANNIEMKKTPAYDQLKDKISLISSNSTMTQFGLSLRQEVSGSHYYSIYYRVLQKDTHGNGKWSSIAKDGALVGDGLTPIYGIQTYIVFKDPRNEYILRASGANFVNGSATGTLEKTNIAYIPTDEKGNITANSWTIESCGGWTAAAHSQSSSLLNNCNIPASVNYAIVKYGFDVDGDGSSAKDFKNWTNDLFFDRGAINSDNASSDEEKKTIEIAYLSHGDVLTAHKDNSKHMLTILGIGSHDELTNDDGVVENAKEQVKQSNLANSLSIFSLIFMGVGIALMPFDVVVASTESVILPTVSMIIGAMMLTTTVAVTIFDMYMQVQAFNPPLKTVDFGSLQTVDSIIDDPASTTTPKGKLKYPEVNGFSWGNYGLYNTHPILHYQSPTESDGKLEFGDDGKYANGAFVENVSPAGYSSGGSTEVLSEYNAIPVGSIIWLSAYNGKESQKFVYNPYSDNRAAFMSTGQAAASHLKFVAYDRTALIIAKMHGFLKDLGVQLGSFIMSMVMDTITLAITVTSIHLIVKGILTLPEMKYSFGRTVEIDDEYYYLGLLFDEELDRPDNYSMLEKLRSRIVANVTSGDPFETSPSSATYSVAHISAPAAAVDENAVLPNCAVDRLLQVPEFTELDRRGRTVLRRSVVRALSYGYTEMLSRLLIDSRDIHAPIQGNSLTHRILESSIDMYYVTNGRSYKLSIKTPPDDFFEGEYLRLGQVSDKYSRGDSYVIIGSSEWENLVIRDLVDQFSDVSDRTTSVIVTDDTRINQVRDMAKNDLSMYAQVKRTLLRKCLAVYSSRYDSMGTLYTHGTRPATKLYASTLYRDLERDMLCGAIIRGETPLPFNGQDAVGANLQVGDKFKGRAPVAASTNGEAMFKGYAAKLGGGHEYYVMEIDMTDAIKNSVLLYDNGLYPGEDGSGVIPNGLEYEITEIERIPFRGKEILRKISVKPTNESLLRYKSKLADSGHRLVSTEESQQQLRVRRFANALKRVNELTGYGVVAGVSEDLRASAVQNIVEATLKQADDFVSVEQNAYSESFASLSKITQVADNYSSHTPRTGMQFGFNKLNGQKDIDKYTIDDSIATFCDNNPEAVLIPTNISDNIPNIICPEKGTDMENEPTVKQLCSGSIGSVFTYHVGDNIGEIRCGKVTGDDIDDDPSTTDPIKTNAYLTDADNVNLLAATLQKVASPDESYAYYNNENMDVMLHNSMRSVFINYFRRFGNNIGSLPKVVDDKISDFADMAYKYTETGSEWNIPARDKNISAVLNAFLDVVGTSYSSYATNNYKTLVVKGGSENGGDYYTHQTISELILAQEESANKQVIMSADDNFGLLIDEKMDTEHMSDPEFLDNNLLSKVAVVAISVKMVETHPELLEFAGKVKRAWIDSSEYYFFYLSESLIKFNKDSSDNYLYQNDNKDDESIVNLLSFALDGDDAKSIYGMNGNKSRLDAIFGVDHISEIIDSLSSVSS